MSQLQNVTILLISFCCFVASYFIFKKEFLDKAPEYEYRRIGLGISALFFYFSVHFFASFWWLTGVTLVQTFVSVLTHGN